LLKIVSNYDLFRYHIYPKCLERCSFGTRSDILGVALDGFPIYGPNDDDGAQLTSKVSTKKSINNPIKLLRILMSATENGTGTSTVIMLPPIIHTLSGASEDVFRRRTKKHLSDDTGTYSALKLILIRYI